MAEPKSKVDEAAVGSPQAGSVVTPGQPVPPAPALTPPAPAKAEEIPAAPEPEQVLQPKQVTQPGPTAQPEPAAEVEIDDSEPVDIPTISWTASEFVAHEKSTGWYLLLFIVAVAFSAVIYLLTKDVVSVGVILVAALLLGIYGSHKPTEQQYAISNSGIEVGKKLYHYDDFKWFAMASEGAFSSLVFMPLKRFAIPLTIYFAPQDEEKIVNVLSTQLPLEEHRPDAVDHLLRRIRF